MTMIAAEDWLKYAVLAAFFSSVIFAVGATIVFPWWRDRMGHALVTMDILWSSTLLPLVLVYLHVISGAGVLYIGYFAATLSLSAVVALWRLYVIASERWPGRRKEKANG